MKKEGQEQETWILGDSIYIPKPLSVFAAAQRRVENQTASISIASNAPGNYFAKKLMDYPFYIYKAGKSCG